MFIPPALYAGYFSSSISPEFYSGVLRPFPPSVSSGFDPDLGSPQISICGESGGTSCFYDLAERYRLRNLVAERDTSRLRETYGTIATSKTLTKPEKGWLENWVGILKIVNFWLDTRKGWPETEKGLPFERRCKDTTKNWDTHKYFH